VTARALPADQREDVLRDHAAIAEGDREARPQAAERLMREHMVRYKEYCEERYPARMDDLVDWS
jgi:DNA-binding FadR family transcriptional regulator